MTKLPRQVWRPLTSVAFLIGLVHIVLTGEDIFVGDGCIPVFAPASLEMKAIADETRTIQLWGDPTRRFTHREYWEGLQGSLAILDEINPVVAAWVRGKERGGMLRFIDHEAELARFDYYNGQLSISHLFFTETEKKKVACLCHEYRHSRQNFGKVERYVLSCTRDGKGNPEIVENDAYLFEREAEAALSPTH